MRPLYTLLALCALSLAADQALAAWAVESNASAALLSPAGASPEQLAVAALFLLVRVGGAGLLCLVVAWCAGRLVSRVVSRSISRRETASAP